MSLLQNCEVLRCKGNNPSAACIFLHGVGESGRSARNHFQTVFRNGHEYIDFYFPTAGNRYMKIRDIVTTYWFDGERYGRGNLDINGSLEHADEVVDMLESMISELEALGISRSRIAIGGNSQGGMVSIYGVYSKGLKAGAVVSVASPLGLFKSSKILEDSTETPLLSLYGSKDAVVTEGSMVSTWRTFRQHNIKATPIALPNCGHNLNSGIIKSLTEWLETIIPSRE